MTSPRPSTRPWLLMFVAVCLVAANLRSSIMGVGPLLEQIAAGEGVSAASLGALASVPLIAWAIVSPLAHGLSARLGLFRTVTWSLVVLAIATIWRSLPGDPINLWLGTALIGASLAIGNVLLPAVIKQEFGERVPLVMGVYSALLGGAGSIGAGLAVPISHLVVAGEPLGWRIALLCTGALLPIAILAWILAERQSVTQGPPRTATQPSTGTTAGRRIWRDGVAWLVALYMGTQAAVFFTVATWLAPIGTSAGRTPVEAGVDVMLYQIFGIGGSLLVPLMFRSSWKKWWPAILPVFTGAAAIGFVTAPELTRMWLIFGGLASGAALSVSLILMAIRARTADTATALSGMSQSVGYLLAAIGPAAFGWIHHLSGEWVAPLILVLVFAAGQLVVGLAVSRERFVFDRAS